MPDWVISLIGNGGLAAIIVASLGLLGKRMDGTKERDDKVDLLKMDGAKIDRELRASESDLVISLAGFQVHGVPDVDDLEDKLEKHTKLVKDKALERDDITEKIRKEYEKK